MAEVRPGLFLYREHFYKITRHTYKDTLRVSYSAEYWEPKSMRWRVVSNMTRILTMFGERVRLTATHPLVAAAQETGLCLMCGEKISSPQSLADGMGPVCSERYWNG